MPRLQGADAGFLYMESPSQAVVTVQCATIARPSPGPPFTVGWLRDRLDARLAGLPSMRSTAVPTPFGLHHPFLAEDPDFDLDHHVFHVAVDGPGGLDRFIADQTATPLDRDRPLWRCTLVDERPTGRQHLVFAEQHALLDGISLTNLMPRLLDGDGPAPARVPGDPLPSRGRQVARALQDQGAQWRRIPELVRDTRRGLAALAAFDEASGTTVPRPLRDVPVTPFNEAHGRRCVSRRTTTPIEDLKRVRAVAGCTVNDVILAVVAGAAREHLLARDALPEQPLVVNMPVAADGDLARVWGNVFANVVTTLATDVADPWDRLAAIAAMTPVAKARLDQVGNRTVARWLDYVVPAVAVPVQRIGARARLRHPDRLDANVLVSNVNAGARRWQGSDLVVEGFCFYGPPIDLCGLNVTVSSYAGTTTWTVQVNADVVDDPDELVAGLQRSLAELLDAAARAEVRPAAAAVAP